MLFYIVLNIYSKLKAPVWQILLNKMYLFKYFIHFCTQVFLSNKKKLTLKCIIILITSDVGGEAWKIKDIKKKSEILTLKTYKEILDIKFNVNIR